MAAGAATSPVSTPKRPSDVPSGATRRPGRIRVGVGGWTYEPWRGVFYPDRLPHRLELAYMAERLTAIEINSTYHGTQKRDSFRRWAQETPDDFVFAVKASRFCTNRKVLAEVSESIERFVTSGVAELGRKLGPINWQFMGTKKFDPEDFQAFLDLLPDEVEGVRLRHALEPRHESFRDPVFEAMARRRGCAVIRADSHDYPAFDMATAPFQYMRLMRTRSDVETGYDETELDAFARDIAHRAQNGDVFAFVISGAKERDPAAAMALIARLGGTG